MLRDHFHRYGFVRLERAFAEAAPALADVIWAELRRRHGIVRDDRGTWTVAEPRRLGPAVRRQAAALATAAVRHAIDELIGTDRPEPFSWGDPLVTLPTPGEWKVPTTGWHIDFPARSNLRLKWLGYLEPVRPRGGGTVAKAGSHQLVAEVLADRDPADPGRSADLRDAVLARTGADDVVELTGEPGDVVFMHPHLFHAPAANHTDAPRLMLTGGLAG